MPAASDTPAASSVARALPTALLAALGIVVAWRDRGSIAAQDWLGWALIAFGVLAAALVSGAAFRPPRKVLIGAAALFALAAWTAFTLVWSPVPSLARDEALLVTVYVVALLVPAVTLRSRGDRIAAAAAVVGLLGAVAVATGFHLAGAGSAAAYLDGRLDFPVSYPNGQAALFLVGLWPALALAAHRRLPLALRALALGAAAGLAGGWGLTQSKGGLLGIAVAAVVVFSVSRARLRLLVPTLLVAGLTAVAFHTLTGPFRASGAGVVHAIRRAGDAELLLVAAGIAVGLVYAAIDRRVELAPRVRAVAASAALLGLVAVIAAAGSIFFARVDHPVRWADDRWTSFKHLPSTHTGSSHLTALGSNRYDFWRVAVQQFHGHWLSGIGARGFRAAYMQHRRSPETPARAHSVELDELSEEGIVGFLLLAAGIGFPLVACAGRARNELVTAGLLGASVGFVAHASVDWVWTFPAIGLPLFVLLGAGASRDDTPPLRAIEYVPAAAVTAAVAIFGLAPPWLASRYLDDALHHPGNEASDIHRAKQLDPLSTDPYLTEWALAPTPATAVAPLVQAVRKNPRVADLWYALGRQQLLAGRKADARRSLSVALFLDPRDPVIVRLYRRASR